MSIDGCGDRTYDEQSELVDIEWRLPARYAEEDDDGATSTDLCILPDEDRFLCDDDADAWSVCIT